MIGSGYCFLLTTLFDSRKSLTQCSLPSFWGVINIGEAHSFAPCGDKMPISTKCCNSFLKALRCITGTGYCLACLAMAPGTKSIWDFLWDKHPNFHQLVWHAPLKLSWKCQHFPLFCPNMSARHGQHVANIATFGGFFTSYVVSCVIDC